MSKNDKTAIKLLGKYADSHNRLEEENKSLKIEVKDLRANLKINKDIIEEFFKKSTVNDKNLTYIEKLKEEIKNLTLKCDKIFKEKEEFRSKLIYIEQVSNDVLNREKQDNDKLNSKNLVLENLIIKKDNQLLIFKRKIDKFFEKDDYNCLNIEKEIYVLEPQASINQINNELLCYKDAYEKLNQHIAETKANLSKYEKIVSEQQLEISKLKGHLKENRNLSPNTTTLPNKDEIQTGILKSIHNSKCNNLILDDEMYNNHSPASNNLQPRDMITNSKTIKKINKINNSSNILTCPNEEIKRYKGSFESEEWLEILHMINITSEEMDRFQRNKMLKKIMDAIEILNKLLVDKNLQIRLLEEENLNLNKKNSDLNNENIKLIKKCDEFTLQINKAKKEDNLYKKNSPITDNSQSDMSSINNNNSKITIKNLNINSINSISKIYENNKIRDQKLNLSNNSNIRDIVMQTDVSEYESDLTKLSRLKGELIISSNLNNKFKSKLQTICKDKQDKLKNVSVSPSAQQDYGKILKTSENKDKDTDYIEVKINRNIYNNENKNELNKKYKINNRLESSNIKKIISNNIDVTNKDKIYSNNIHQTSKNNILFISKVKDDNFSLKEDLNDSMTDMSKQKNLFNINSNVRNIFDATICSYASSDVRNNFANESGFISNANDLEHFNINIKNSNN